MPALVDQDLNLGFLILDYDPEIIQFTSLLEGITIMPSADMFVCFAFLVNEYFNCVILDCTYYQCAKFVHISQIY